MTDRGSVPPSCFANVRMAPGADTQFRPTASTMPLSAIRARKLAVHALPGVAVGQDRKGHQYKGIRHFRLDGPHGIQKARIGAQGLKQEIPGPQRRELLCHSGYTCSAGTLGIRSRAKVGKHCRAHLLCGLHSQLPACLRQLFPAGCCAAASRAG